MDVILVVGLRLGCLNHALLTVEAIAARGLALAGWVGNSVDPAFARRGCECRNSRAHASRRPASASFPGWRNPTVAAAATHLASASRLLRIPLDGKEKIGLRP